MRTKVSGRRVTQHDIAEEAGVSQITVSRALRNEGLVKPDARRKVREAAARLGYRYHSFAASMRSGRSGAYGLLTSSDEASALMPPQQLWAFHDACAAQGRRLVLTRIPDRKLQSGEDLPDLMREWAVDGVVINYGHRPEARLMRDVRALRLPVVWLNTEAPEAVRPDFEGAVLALAEKAYAAGHRRLALVSRPEELEQPAVAEAFEGWGRSRKVRVESFVLDKKDGTMMDAASAWLSRADFEVTAVITRNRWTAIATYAAAMKLGLTIPGDLSLLMIGPSFFENLGLHLTGMSIPYEELADAAVGRLMKLEEGGRRRVLAPVPFHFSEGTSLGAPA